MLSESEIAKIIHDKQTRRGYLTTPQIGEIASEIMQRVREDTPAAGSVRWGVYGYPDGNEIKTGFASKRLALEWWLQASGLDKTDVKPVQVGAGDYLYKFRANDTRSPVFIRSMKAEESGS